MRGWLKKKSPSFHASLQKRFFVLNEQAKLLSYFANEAIDDKPKGTIPLSALVSVSASATALTINVGYRNFHLVAESPAIAEAWRDAIATTALVVPTPSDQPAASSSSASAGPTPIRPGVMYEGTLLRGAPEWSVRRVTEQTRLKQQWFILSSRALRWYQDETLARPRRAALTSPRRHRRVVSATYRHNAGRAQGPAPRPGGRRQARAPVY